MPTVVVLVAPVSGQIIPIEEVPDPVFAEKMMGESFSIMPDNGEVVAPVAGKSCKFFQQNMQWNFRGKWR